ncbi:transposase [Salmonella enterica]|nr:transposase [Salmonella enterica]
MEQKTLSAEPRRSFSNEFKLQMVKLASQPGASVARIAREHDINDNLLFKWLRLWQNEGRISRRLPATTSSGAGVELLPVEITPDEQKEPVAALTPSLSTQTTVSASSCKVEFRHGNMTLENPSPELLTVLIRELSGRASLPDHPRSAQRRPARARLVPSALRLRG